MTSFFRTCWHRRWFRALTWIFVTLLTLFVLFYQWVNWKGAHRWQAAQDMLARAGETLDFRKVTPDPVPDEQNFCAIPLLKNLVLENGPDGEATAENRKKLEALALPTSGKDSSADPRPKLGLGVTLGRPTDLKAWAAWLRQEGSLPMPPDSGNAARDVLAALSIHDALLAELKAGLARTETQWTPHWRTRELPDMLYEVTLSHYKSTQASTQHLALRATAAAHAGDAAKAHQSLLIRLRLARASLDDPFLIGTLVGMTDAIITCGATWEVCRLHAGTPEDFRTLEMELRRLDMRASLLRAFRGEMAGGAGAIQQIKQTRDGTLLQVMESNPPAPNVILAALPRGIPSGWFDMNAAAIVELNHDYVIVPLRDHGLAACVKRQPELEELLKSQQAHPILHLDTVFARLVMAASFRFSARAASTQDILNQAIIACALERHFAAHQAYPESLVELDLEGRALPLDVFSGKAPRYRKTPDGRYALWCVGFDGKDDGGKRVLDEKAPEKTKFHDLGYQGDWVWDFSTGN